MTFIGETQTYSDWDAQRAFPDEIVRDANGLLIERGEEEIEGRGRQDRFLLGEPVGVIDPAWQQTPATRLQTRALDVNLDAQLNTGVNPSDNVLEVGPNHVIQMINGGSGSYFRIYDKAGTAVGAQTYMDNFVNAIGSISAYSGAGDPIVLYDALADRWLMSEFSSSGNRMIVAISTTANPTGTWYAYSFTAPGFPDYPKYGVWNGMYIVTTNESSPSVYALDRTKMLAGNSTATAQRFTTAGYPTIGFESLTPVTFEHGTAPPAGAEGMCMRIAEAAWGGGIANDRLELWTMTIDWVTPGNSAITGPTFLNTAAFDTGLCGYTSFSCIDQPSSSTNLDPLREVLMNRIQYRNLGTHEAMVCCHSIDVNGADLAGVRWYELRRTGGIGNAWTIFQQGTWSPDTHSRWMGAIAINNAGDIGLAYNVSSSTVFPSIRYTGRYASDPLGTMTFAETSIVAGTNANGSNRYGDYNSLDVDPADGNSFWGTSNYNPASGWRTRMFAFSFPSQSLALGVKAKLEGPFQVGTGLMYDSLRVKGLLPLAEPYTVLGYAFTGGGGESMSASVLTTTGNDAIVDWAIVELRDAVTPTIIVASKAVLMQRDGDLVAVDGISPLSFTQPAGNYHVAVRHRNHLGIMTLAAVGLSGSIVNVDFTQGGTATYGTEARKNVSGTQVMWAGNAFPDDKLVYTNTNNDRDQILLAIGSVIPTNTATGYLVTDTNLDGKVKYTGVANDRDIILVNIGGTVPTNTRDEQLP